MNTIERGIVLGIRHFEPTTDRPNSAPSNLRHIVANHSRGLPRLYPLVRAVTSTRF
jgi:hypothetical protein